MIALNFVRLLSVICALTQSHGQHLGLERTIGKKLPKGCREHSYHRRGEERYLHVHGVGYDYDYDYDLDVRKWRRYRYVP